MEAGEVRAGGRGGIGADKAWFLFAKEYPDSFSFLLIMIDHHFDFQAIDLGLPGIEPGGVSCCTLFCWLTGDRV